MCAKLRVLPTETRRQLIAIEHYSGIYIYCVKKYHVHFRISYTYMYTMNAQDIFRSSTGCEIILMIKARIRLIFARYKLFKCKLASYTVV